MLLDCLLLLVSLVLVLKGGDLFVASSVRIADLLRLPRIVIGSTLVSLATTTPEITVSIIASLRDEPGLAVGNAVGSCICNLGLILGTMALLSQLTVHPAQLRIPFVTMVAFGVLVFAISYNLELTRSQGLSLLGCGLAYFVWDFRRHLRGRAAPTKKELEAQIRAHESPQRGGLAVTGQFLLGAVLVVGGSRFLVDSTVRIAGGLGVPTIIIGLTVVAVGTSLPELVTAITSARRQVSDLAVGNLLGANIANLTLIIGSASALHPLTMTRLTQLLNFPAMLVGMVLAAGLGISDRRITRWEGGLLLVYYFAYVGLVVGLAATGRR
jgi:cation:H+ antiporter